MNFSEKNPKTTLKRQICDNFEIVKEKQQQQKKSCFWYLVCLFLQFDHFLVLNFKKVHQNTDLSFFKLEL